MRINLNASAAGDIRVRLLGDKPKKPVPKRQPDALLVYCPELQDDIYPPVLRPVAGYGEVGKGRRFGSLAKSRIRDVGAVLDNGALSNVVFLTGTLPGSTQWAMLALSAWSAWIISRLGQWFRDKFPGCQYFGVWEFQKRGALHLHVAVRLRDPGEVRALKRCWRTRWVALLDKVGAKSGVDMFARPDGTSWQQKRGKIKTDAQSVDKSVARYLSKYCSKAQDKRRKRAMFPPASWWFASANIRTISKQLRYEHSISNLYLGEAHTIFDQIAGHIVATNAQAYRVSNPYDSRYQGLIAFLPGPAAGALLRQLLLRLRTYELDVGEYTDLRWAYLAHVRRIFEATQTTALVVA